MPTASQEPLPGALAGPAAVERLSFWRKVAYGAGEMGPSMAGSTMIFFQMVFLTNVAGLRPALAGSVLLVGKIWDAVNDPLIGWLSDRTDSRHGRRLPWMLWSVVPFGLLFAAQWWVPPFAGPSPGAQIALFWYYVLVSLLFNTAYTAVTLPYQALTPELSHDYDERSRITGFRQVFSLAGSVGGLVLAIPIFQFLSAFSRRAQYAIYGSAIALIGIGTMAWCLAGVWRIAVAGDRRRRIVEESADPHLGIAEQLRIVFSNRPFLLVCAIYLCSWLALQFTATILPYYVESWMRLPAAQFPLLALTVQGTALLLIPLFGWISVRVGKKGAYFIGMPFWMAAQVGLLMLQPGQAKLMFVLAFVAGAGVAVCYLIPNAMLPDVIEFDQLKSGRRREGVFFAFVVFLQKVALALGTFIVGQALSAAGFLSAGPGEPSPIQPDTALAAIRLAIGPLPAVCLVLGMFFTWLYPLTKARHAALLAELSARARVG
jgi:GPH family glycoside/pentoside/hexuronide:cation symporter